MGFTVGGIYLMSKQILEMAVQLLIILVCIKYLRKKS